MHFVLSLKVLESRFGILIHGTELINIEEFTIATDTFLFENDRSWIFKENNRSDNDTNEKAEEAADESAKDVH